MARCFLSLYCPDLEAGRLKRLVDWCDRYSPLVSQDGDDGIILDITGCAHLFGGENRLLSGLHRRLHGMSVEAHAAIADSWGAAWALARYGNRYIAHGDHAIPALDPLPVEALRLPREMVLKLRRLGLLTIASVRKIPRDSLSARFGSTLLWRLDQAFQAAEEPLTPWRPPAAYRASRVLAEPVSTAGSVEYMLHGLLQEVSACLKRDHLGSRRMDLACYRADGTVDRCEVRTSQPTHAVSHLMRLFSERLEKLWAEFGFESFTLSVRDAEALPPRQLSFLSEEAEEDEDSFHALIDRLGMRLGFTEVNRIQVRESYLPEYAVELRSATGPAVASAEWPGCRVRPIRLIDPPMPIQVSILIPGGSPVQFLIGQRKHRIVRSEGPERLTAEWWRGGNSRWETRDYYRVEDDNGFRFWIFCDPVEHWFLHGHFG